MRPENCAFAAVEVVDDGQCGLSGPGIVAFEVQRTGNSRAVGFLVDEVFNYPRGLDRENDYLYAATRDSSNAPWLVTVDVSDPTDMSIVHRIADPVGATPYVVEAIADDSRLCVVSYRYGVKTLLRTMFDITEPTEPVLIDSIERDFYGLAISYEAQALVGQRLYVWADATPTTDDAYLCLYDLSDDDAVLLHNEIALNAHFRTGQVAANDTHVAISYTTYRDGAFVGELIGYEVQAPWKLTEMWRAEAPLTNYYREPRVIPIAIRNNRLWTVLRDGLKYRVQVRDMQSGTLLATSREYNNALDWSVHDAGYFGLAIRKDAGVPTGFMQPMAVWRECAMDGALNDGFVLPLAGYGWWPEGWLGAPISENYRLDWGSPDHGYMAGAPLERKGDGNDVYTDGAGIQWDVILQGSAMRLYRRDSTDPTDWILVATVDDSGQYDSPRISGDDRLMTITARNTETEELTVWDATTGGETWSGPHAVTA